MPFEDLTWEDLQDWAGSRVVVRGKSYRNRVDALRWYRHSNKRGGWGHDHQGDAVAESVSETHPDEALSIWRAQAVSHIRITKPSAYEVAGRYLRKMRTVYERTGRRTEWEGLLRELRTDHARKRRLMEVLDRLEGKRSRILKR